MADVRKLHIVGDYYEFNISAGPEAFEKARARLKDKVPHGDAGRTWDQERKVWVVHKDHRETLGKIFGNFESEIEAIEAQGALF